MKNIFVTALAIIVVSWTSIQAQTLQEFKKIEVPSYPSKLSKEYKQIRIPLSFANSILPKNCIPDSIKGKAIFSVKLVYTRYRESATFDQEKLNRQRVSNLIACNPALFSGTAIKWYFVEQTLEDSIRAKTLFHGFEILYKNKPASKEYAMNDKILNTKALVSKLFSISSAKDNTIKGNEGTSIHIKPNSFLVENGKIYKGEVKIELKEAIKLESIILANLVTMSDGNALESGGMIFIDAKTKDGKNLILDPGKPMEVSINDKDGIKPGMQIWEPEKNGKFINWKNPQPLNNGESVTKNNPSLKEIKKSKNQETAVDIKIASSFDDGFLESVQCWCGNNLNVFYNYRLFRNGKIFIELYEIRNEKESILISDTFYDASNLNNKNVALPKTKTIGEDCFTKVYIKNNQLDYSGKIQAFTNRNDLEYKFNISKIGTWANIDRLANDPKTRQVDFLASLPKGEQYSDISFYLVFKDKNIFIPGFKSQKRDGYGFSHGDFETPKLPVGANASVLCICHKDGKPYVAIKHIVISESQNVAMTPIASNDDDIKKLIRDNF